MRVPKVSTTSQESLTEENRKINFYTKPSMYVSSDELLEDEKTRTKFIKKIERAVRSSLEYREYISFLKSEIDMNSCLFYKDIDRKELENIRIEIHHDPFTLYDLCEIVIMKRINNDESINTLMVAEEVMKIHFMGLVGLVPLSYTVHQLVHSGQLFVPIDKVYGNLKEFIERYKDGLSPDHFTILQKSIDMTLQMEEEGSYNPEVLERCAIYLDVKGMDSVRSIEQNQEQLA